MKPGTEDKPAVIAVDAECFIRHADRYLPRSLEISIDLKDLVDAIDRDDWEFDDYSVDWVEGTPFVQLSFRPTVD